jgi:hypothetical protein
MIYAGRADYLRNLLYTRHRAERRLRETSGDVNRAGEAGAFKPAGIPVLNTA